MWTKPFFFGFLPFGRDSAIYRSLSSFKRSSPSCSHSPLFTRFSCRRHTCTRSDALIPHFCRHWLSFALALPVSRSHCARHPRLLLKPPPAAHSVPCCRCYHSFARCSLSSLMKISALSSLPAFLRLTRIPSSPSTPPRPMNSHLITSLLASRMKKLAKSTARSPVNQMMAPCFLELGTVQEFHSRALLVSNVKRRDMNPCRSCLENSTVCG